MTRAINFTLMFDTNEYQTEMDSTAKTLKGVSDTVEIIGEAIAETQVRDSKTTRSSASAWLEDSFRGSYGLNFRLDITGERAERNLVGIHDDVIAEIMTYYFSDLLHLEDPELSPEATAVIARLSEISTPLKRRLHNPLKDMHAVTMRTGSVLKFFKRTAVRERTEIVRLSNETYDYLTRTRIEQREERFSIMVNRFNSFTGNGRLVIAGSSRTTAFGISGRRGPENEVRKTILSENLHNNTDVEEEDRQFITITGRRVKLSDNSTIKILIDSVDDE